MAKIVIIADDYKEKMLKEELDKIKVVYEITPYSNGYIKLSMTGEQVDIDPIVRKVTDFYNKKYNTTVEPIVIKK